MTKATPKTFSVTDLKELWLDYHQLVHPGDCPCDANPGDSCYIDAFLFWLENDRIPTEFERENL